MRHIVTIFMLLVLPFTLSCDSDGGDDREVISGSVMAIAEKEGSDETIKVGGRPGSVPPGSTVTVTNLETMESKTTVALGDGSFDPEFTGSTNDMYLIEVSLDGEIVDEFTIGVTLLTDIVQTSLGTLGDVPSALEIRDGIAYVVNGFSDNIQLFDLTGVTPQELSTVAVPPGSDPSSVELTDDNRAYTANLIGQSVTLVNLDTGECELIYTREIPSDDTGCSEVIVLENAFEDPSGVKLVDNKLFVTNNNFDEFFFPNGNGFVTVIDTETGEVTSVIETDGANPGDINLIGNDMFVLNTGNFIFNSETGEFQCDTDFPPSVTVIDTETEMVTDTIAIPLSEQNPLVCAPGTMAFTPDDSFAYLGLSLVGGMLKIDIDNRTVIRGTSNPIAFTDLSGLNSVTDIGFNSNGLGFAALFNSDQIAAFDPESDTITPFPFIFPVPAGIKAVNPDSEFFDGVQYIDFREDQPSGPELYFITTLSSRLGSVDTQLLIQ